VRRVGGRNDPRHGIAGCFDDHRWHGGYTDDDGWIRNDDDRGVRGRVE
jgi:hypothetical protein